MVFVLFLKRHTPDSEAGNAARILGALTRHDSQVILRDIHAAACPTAGNINCNIYYTSAGHTLQVTWTQDLIYRGLVTCHCAVHAGVCTTEQLQDIPLDSPLRPSSNSSDASDASAPAPAPAGPVPPPAVGSGKPSAYTLPAISTGARPEHYFHCFLMSRQLTCDRRISQAVEDSIVPAGVLIGAAAAAPGCGWGLYAEWCYPLGG